jgi:hypothetical protein
MLTTKRLLFNFSNFLLICFLTIFLLSSISFAQAPILKETNPLNVQTIVLKGQVSVKFNMPKTDRATVKLFTVIGAEVSTLVNRTLEAGNYEFTAGKLSKGFYFLRLYTANNKTTTRLIQIIN